MSPLRLLLLGGIAALGSLAIQMIVPALPEVASELHVDAGDAQLLVSVYLAALALGQLAWAPVADAVGRRPVLLGGVLAFGVGSIACALAPSWAMLLAGRLLQAIGASGALIAARTMAAEAAGHDRRAGALAILSTVTLLSPAVAPVIGVAVASVAGWRPLFWLLVLLAVGCASAAAWGLPETQSRADARPPARDLLRAYPELIADRRFLALTLANGSMSAGFYVFLGTAPFILTRNFGASSMVVGICLSSVAAAIILGTLAVPKLERRGSHVLRMTGSAILATGALALAGTALFGSSATLLIASMCVASLGSGMVSPSLLADALQAAGKRTGVAASLFGTTQMGCAAILSAIVVQWDGGARWMIGTIALLYALTLVGRSICLRADRGSPLGSRMTSTPESGVRDGDVVHCRDDFRERKRAVKRDVRRRKIDPEH